jgi:type 1 glutamine amidotransferase
MKTDIAALPGFKILATLSLDGRPVVWVKELCSVPVGGVCAPSPTNGRMFYTIRGHDASVFKELPFRKLVLNGILWATHRLEQQ